MPWYLPYIDCLEILNTIIFTILLWLKLDYNDSMRIPWAVVLAPLWLSNILRVSVEVRSLLRRLKLLDFIPFETWVKVYRNDTLGRINRVCREICSAVLKIVLVLAPNTSYMTQFTPIWTSSLLSFVFFLLKKPRTGPPFDPNFIYAVPIAFKLDGMSELSWGVIFTPLWLNLAGFSIFVLLLATQLTFMENLPNKRKAYQIACISAAAGLNVFCIALVKFVEYLHNGSEPSFLPVAIPLLVAEVFLLVGFSLFSHYLTKHEIDMAARRQEREQNAEAAETKLAKSLEFFDMNPDEYFLRLSQNFFCRLQRATNSLRTAVVPYAAGQPPMSDTVAECLICCAEEGVEFILLDCGHGSFCETCCKEMVKSKICPLCRAPIAKIARLRPDGLTETSKVAFSASIANVQNESSSSSISKGQVFPIISARDDSERNALRVADNTTHHDIEGQNGGWWFHPLQLIGYS